jgi:hypothetical protein
MSLAWGGITAVAKATGLAAGESPARKSSQNSAEGQSGQWHFCTHFRVDERLVERLGSCVPRLLVRNKRHPDACLLPWRGVCLTVGAESLRGRPPGGFVVTSRPAPVRGCGCRSPAARRPRVERRRDREVVLRPAHACRRTAGQPILWISIRLLLAQFYLGTC